MATLARDERARRARARLIRRPGAAWAVAAVTVAAAALTGCARTDVALGTTDPPAALDADAPDASADAAADTTPDATRDVTPDTAGDPDCPWVPTRVGAIDAWPGTGRQPLVADGRVLVHAREDGLVRAVAVSPETGDRAPLTPAGVESTLVDAIGDTIVWLQDAGTGAVRYVPRATLDGEPVVGLTAFSTTATEIALPTTSRQAAAGFAALVDPDTPRIEVLTGSGSVVQDTARPIRFATVGDGLLAWTEATERGPSRLYAARIGDGAFAPIDLGEVSQFRPEIAIADGAVYAVGLDDSALRIGLDRGITRVDEGPCSLPVAGGGAVVFTCGASALGGWFALGDRLLWLRGDARDEVVAGGDRLLGGVRVHGDAVVWVSYASIESGEGLVELWTPGLGTAPEPVAPAGAGCYTCGAYWPPPTLAVDRGLAAWNYADPDPDGFDAPQAIGWARLERRCP